ncbi:hypothetical protein CesoFtcFv8_021221 [Champsocephalus esox]|uniref:Sulfatase N-terminal domain-containing protein n=1 Tax=Champsocephalus esox TaxID=159716 RepID=A0AAN8BDT0_9TELE|nr:hypothetical protein CesoFtcFv8_021221 [Champsocephalus esox]
MRGGFCSVLFLVIGGTLLSGCLGKHKSTDGSFGRDGVKRASQLMTGRYQIHTGLQHSIIRSRQPLCLPADVPTLPERLVEAGYATHMVGKWHLGFCRPSCLPTGRGFQSFMGTLTGSGDHFTYRSCDGAQACGFDLHEGDKPAWKMAGNYSTLLYVDRVKQILRSHDPLKPLFLYLSFQSPHTPLQVPDHFLHYYDSQGNRLRRHYAAMLSCLDEGVGKVVQELKTSGLYQNSVLIYSSDNGGQPLSGGSNWPLKGTHRTIPWLTLSSMEGCGAPGWARRDRRGRMEKGDGRIEKMMKIKHCKVCKLKALFRKVTSRLERKTLFS